MKFTFSEANYKVKKQPEIFDGDRKFWGQTDYGAPLIRLDNTIPAGKQAETLWHEIVHVIAYHTGLNLKESQVIALSNGIIQALSLNK